MFKHTFIAMVIGISTIATPVQANKPINTTTVNIDHPAALSNMLQASRKWIKAFNAGNAQAAAAAYLTSATMEAKPFGAYKGRKEIEAFWTDLIAKGARDLKYTQIKLEQIDANTVLLSANWSMNIGSGIISKERWVKHKGQWMLEDDQFEVLQQNKP